MKEIERQLVQSFAAAERWLEKMEDHSSRKPGEKEWNISQVLEHIVLCNKFLLEDMMEEANPGGRQGNFFVGVRGPLNWPHPSRTEPKGRMKKDEIQNSFRKQFASSLQLLEQMKDKEGKSRVAQGLLFLSLHIKRHVEQMERLERNFSEDNFSKTVF